MDSTLDEDVSVAQENPGLSATSRCPRHTSHNPCGKQKKTTDPLYYLDIGYGEVPIYPASSSSDDSNCTSGRSENSPLQKVTSLADVRQTIRTQSSGASDPLIRLPRDQLRRTVDASCQDEDHVSGELQPSKDDCALDNAGARQDVNSEDPQQDKNRNVGFDDIDRNVNHESPLYEDPESEFQIPAEPIAQPDTGDGGVRRFSAMSWRDCDDVAFFSISSSTNATSDASKSTGEEVDGNHEMPNELANRLRSDVEAALPRRLGCEKRVYNFVRRSRRVNAPEHVVHKKLSLKEMLKVRGMWCCKSHMCCSKIDIDVIRDVRLEFYQLHFEDRQKWWMDSLKRFTVRENGRDNVCPVLNKIKVCCTAWCNIVGVNRRTVSRKIKEARLGGMRPEHGLRGSMRVSNDYVTITALTKKFVEDHADQMPDETVTNVDGEIRVKLKLPASYNKKGIYDEISTDRTSSGLSTGSLITFYKVWRMEFWHVDITKSNDFTKCAQCVEFKQYINSAATDRARQSFKRDRATHNNLQFAHRMMYTLWKEESIRRPGESLCMIIDGMDQAKTSVPHMARTFYSKDLMSYNMMKTNLTGILAHGRKPSIHIHSWFPFFPHDSNSVISSVMKVLRFIQGTGERLPPILRLQADNCWRENKNRFVFAFLSLLVKFEIFKEVEMGFMIVGHTHTDVDAMFSVISRRLKERNAYTIDHLHALVRSSHKDPPLPECSVIDEVADFRAAVLPYLVSGQDRIVGHIHPHLFRFYMVNDNPVMQYKEFCNDVSWKPDDEPIHWFIRDAGGQYAGPMSIEEFVVKPVAPQALKDLDSGKKGVRKFLEVMEKERRHWDVLQERIRQQKEDACTTWEKFLLDSEITCDPINAPVELKQGFWPTPASATEGAEDGTADVREAPRPPTYCGPARFAPDRPLPPLPEFDPYVDVSKGDFVIMRPDKKESKEGVPFWVGEALTGIEMDVDSLNYKKFLYDYWVPCGRKGLNNAELYANAWEKTWKRWGTSDWQPAVSIVWSWTRFVRDGNTNKKKFTTGLKIPQIVAAKAQQSFVQRGAESDEDSAEDDDTKDSE
jgi:hypothetical protein